MSGDTRRRHWVAEGFKLGKATEAKRTKLLVMALQEIADTPAGGKYDLIRMKMKDIAKAALEDTNESTVSRDRSTG